MPQTSFFQFVLSIVDFFQRLVIGFFHLLERLVALSPLPDWIDWGLIGLVVIGLVLAIFLAAPGKD